MDSSGTYLPICQSVVTLLMSFEHQWRKNQEKKFVRHQLHFIQAGSEQLLAV